jgi:exonuclease III
MSQRNCNLLCWNVRGLNARARRDSVRSTVASSGATLVCLQETKFSTWTPCLVTDTLAARTKFCQKLCYPASGWNAGGGILLAGSEHFLDLQTSGR